MQLAQQYIGKHFNCKRVLLECPQWLWTRGTSSKYVHLPFDCITKKNCKISFELENREMKQILLYGWTSN